MKLFRSDRNSVHLSIAIAIVLMGAITPALSQEIVDKTVAVVSDGRRKEVITYSDLLWELALQPRVRLDSLKTEDLNGALQTTINQRIYALESLRLSREPPTEEEITKKIGEIVSFFPSPAAFQARLRQVGFDSVSDPAFEKLIERRLSTDKYVEFRFGSFVVITAEDEARYYREIYVPEFRRKTPDLLVPSLENSRAQIREELMLQRTATAIETFLDEAKRRVTVEILSEVGVPNGPSS